MCLVPGVWHPHGTPGFSTVESTAQSQVSAAVGGCQRPPCAAGPRSEQGSRCLLIHNIPVIISGAKYRGRPPFSGKVLAARLLPGRVSAQFVSLFTSMDYLHSESLSFFFFLMEYRYKSGISI